MKVFITGGTGFIGVNLASRLIERGDRVTVLSRNPVKADAKFSGKVTITAGDPEVSGDWQRSVDGQEALFNFCGEPVFAKKWTPERKQKFWDSRIESTKRLVEAIGLASAKPKVLLSGSALGIYGDQGDLELTEESRPGDDFGARLNIAWEEAANGAAGFGVRVVNIRTGDVLGRGGLLARMEGAFKAFAGGPLGSGRQYMSWIHIDDYIAILIKAMEDQSINGPVNMAAPHPVTNREFSVALGRVLNRPSALPVPKFVLKLRFGEGAGVILASRKALPKKALESGYKFNFADLDAALNDIYQKG